MKNLSKKIRFCLFLIFFAVFFSEVAFAAGEENSTVIKIENAQKSEYKKNKETNEDLIVLEGQVKVSVTKGSKTTVIEADIVNYNRATEMLYAEGNVSLKQSSGTSSGGESVTAKSLLFNTSTMEGIFDNGRAVQTSSDAINLPSGSTLIVASNIFGRDSDGTIAFKSGELTFCDDEDPHWRIKASRIWLLPGGEFSFLNAVLYVGRIPLMWLPAFYYPKDELVFNPTFGYKYREGYFINTTTYLYGRKPKDAVSTSALGSSSSSSSDDDDKIDFFSFMNTGAMKEQVREGLVLHNLNTDFTGDTTNYFKVMADYYSNLGVMFGYDTVLSPGSYLTSFKSNLKIAFSNTVFKNNSVYLPYDASGEIQADRSNFMTFSAPFRYQANLAFTIAKPFSLTVSLPVYSDPYFDYDFNNRAETMDWIDYAMSGTDTDDDDDSVTETSSFTWNVNGSYSFKLPDIVNPWISSLAISSFTSSVVYSSKANEELSSDERNSSDSTWVTYTPERKFYYPSLITPLKTSGKIAGTLVQIPKKQAASSKSSSSTPSLNVPEELMTEEELQKKKEEEEKKKAAKDGKNPVGSGESVNDADKKTTEAEDVIFGESALPLITTSAGSVKSIGGLTYSLGYSVTPDFTSQISYTSSNLTTPEAFEWDNMQSTYLQVKSPAVLTSTLGYRDGFLSLTDAFTFNPVYQSHPYLNDDTDNGGYSETSISSIKTADYNARKLDLTDVNTLTIKPFYYTEHFSGTSIAWNSTVKMVRTEYVGTDPEEPEWEYLTMELWSEDSVTAHTLSATLAATEGDYSQSLVLTSTLPPQVDAYYGTLTLGFPCVTFTAASGIKQTSSDDSTWVKQDLSQSLAINLFSSNLKFTQSYIYDFEESESESFKLALSGYGAQLAYTASYVAGYEFDVDYNTDGSIKTRKGWKAKSSDEKEFQPYSLSFAYTKPSKTFKYWTDRISFAPTLSTSVVYDFLRPTSSYFVFKPGITLKINDFLDLSFSAESRNSSIYRYFCTDDDFDFYYGKNGERNIFQDLINSFRFDDDDKRKASAFKMKSLKVAVTHDLDDWDFNCELSISPRYVTEDSKSYYDFSPYFTLSVSWRPLSSMKTEIVDKYGEWQLNP